MFKNVLIPDKIGSYYIFTKRVLIVEVTPFYVQGMLVVYSGRTKSIKNAMTISLKDFSSQAMVGAVKKIATTIGKYDELVTTLSTTSIILKEIELPFIGHDKISMILPYEVEPLLPFSLEEVDIDFIIIDEDPERFVSKVMVAAAKKDDIKQHLSLFEKAEISVQSVSVDMFALYQLYHDGLYGLKKDQKAEQLVDLGAEVVRILHMQQGKLVGMRVIPFGVSDIAQEVSKELGLSYYDVMQHCINGSEEIKEYDLIIQKQLQILYKKVDQTKQFFSQQYGNDFLMPDNIYITGLGAMLPGVLDVARSSLGYSVMIVNVSDLLKRLKVKCRRKDIASNLYIKNIALAQFIHDYEHVTFLKLISQRVESKILLWQLFAMLLFTSTIFGTVWWSGYQEEQRWERAILKSRKQLIKAVEEHMNIDMKGKKSSKEIVETVETTLQKEHKLWFSFSKHSEQSYLECLHELSTKIDKESIGLELRKMHMDYEKVTLDGTVKSFESLETFGEELAELEMFTLVEKPRETTFHIQLNVKDKSKGSV